MYGVLYPRNRGAASRGVRDEPELNDRFSAGSEQALQSAGREIRVNAMTIEIFTIEIFIFFAIAASLIAAGFVSGPVVARRVNSTHSHFDRPHLYR